MSRAIWITAFLVAFLLGVLAISIGVAYLSWWASDPSAPLRHEALIGSAMALTYGLFPVGAAWALARWNRSDLPQWSKPASLILVAVIMVVLATTILISARDT